MNLIGPLDESESLAHMGFVDMALPSSWEEDDIATRNLFITTPARLLEPAKSARCYGTLITQRASLMTVRDNMHLPILLLDGTK